MEKVKNGYYKAVSIISYIAAGLITAGVLFLGICLISNNVVINEIGKILIEEAEIGEVSPDMLEFAAEMIKALLLIECITYLGIAVYTFAQAFYFNKYSNLTNEEACKFYNKCVAWCVFAFLVSGLIVGILALIGLLNVQKKQKEQFENKTVTASASEEISIEKLDKIKDRIEKLTELKISGAITEEEFNKMRDKIMKEVKPKQETVTQSDETAERLKKLESLKESGTITEEEFKSLKDRILKK